MSDDDDDDDEHEMMWEEEARIAVETAIARAEMDDVRGTVTIPSLDDHRYGREFKSFEDLQQHLEELYDEMWYANAPFEGGEAVFESDSNGEVGNLLAETDFEDFFVQIDEPENAEELLTSQNLVDSYEHSKIIRLGITGVTDELLAYFAKHPHRLREMDPDDFEKLMASVFRNQGFDVTKTPKVKDGGFDLMLVRKGDAGDLMTLVECKRYAENNRVGVEIVRGLYGVVEANKASTGLIATTSFFTKGAVQFREQVPYRMKLADFNAMRNFLAPYKR